MVALALLGALTGCGDDKVQHLEDENAELRSQVSQLQDQLGRAKDAADNGPSVTPIAYMENIRMAFAVARQFAGTMSRTVANAGPRMPPIVNSASPNRTMVSSAFVTMNAAQHMTGKMMARLPTTTRGHFPPAR